jgi:hypothetical protein
MNDNITYAYHPTQPANATPWSSNAYDGYWDAIKAAQETCPSGWRRPTDGSTSGAIPISLTNASNITASEIRQSLLLKPSRGSGLINVAGSAWGYYADGYFDRRPIVTSVSSAANSAVSRDTKEVAYIGRLTFNAANGNRSLFIPVGGRREAGRLFSSGGVGSYWSSSSSGTTMHWTLEVSNGYGLNFYPTVGHNGYSVRCVVE